MPSKRSHHGSCQIVAVPTAASCGLQDCPFNMVAIYGNSTYPTSNSYFTNNTDGTMGFTNVLACVNQDGYGYNGRVSQMCEKGYYNKRDNRLDCTACGYGLTTADEGSGVVATDCGIAPGFGYDGATIRECPLGTYNNDTIDLNLQTACDPCSTGTTTQSTGSNSPDQCNLCAIGYGGPMCAFVCGGDVADSQAVYPGTVSLVLHLQICCAITHQASWGSWYTCTCMTW
jgi:hypothetical protein